MGHGSIVKLALDCTKKVDQNHLHSEDGDFQDETGLILIYDHSKRFTTWCDAHVASSSCSPTVTITRSGLIEALLVLCVLRLAPTRQHGLRGS